MTKEECKKLVLEQLKDIISTIKECEPDIDYVSLSYIKDSEEAEDYLSFFSTVDENSAVEGSEFVPHKPEVIKAEYTNLESEEN